MPVFIPTVVARKNLAQVAATINERVVALGPWLHGNYTLNPVRGLILLFFL